jgi:5-methylcytosine-specific restriction protein A
MSRREFPKDVRRAAYARANGHCEATGGTYGLNKGERCNMPLDRGVEYDHAIADSIGGEPTLDNCVVACSRCHSFKTRYIDIPKAAKTLRQQDKHNGIRGPKHKWPSRPFGWQKGNVRELNGDLE